MILPSSGNVIDPKDQLNLANITKTGSIYQKNCKSCFIYREDSARLMLKFPNPIFTY